MAASVSARGRRGPPALSSVEWPTLALAVVTYGAWLLLTWFHASLPWPLLLAGGAWTVAWQASLQHELIHGYPTHLPWLNRALGLPPLLHVPFDRCRALHLAHHRDERLTDPLDDPETQYLTPAAWHELGASGRLVVHITAAPTGRLVIGPVWAVARFLWREEPPVRASGIPAFGQPGPGTCPCWPLCWPGSRSPAA